MHASDTKRPRHLACWCRGSILPFQGSDKSSILLRATILRIASVNAAQQPLKLSSVGSSPTRSTILMPDVVTGSKAPSEGASKGSNPFQGM